MGWDQAWEITRNTFAYTNHTLLPEALETWPVALFGRLLPRHLEIIYEINRRFLDEVRMRFPGDDAAGGAHVADRRGARRGACAWPTWPPWAASRSTASPRCTPSCSSDTILQDFHELWPEKFNNITNGVTPRRFVVAEQPAPGAAAHRALRQRRLDPGPRRAARAGAATPTTPASTHDWRAVKTAAKRRPGRLARTKHAGVERRPRVPVRHPGQAHPRVQAPAPERPAHHHPLPPPESRSRTSTSRRAPSSSAARRRPATSWPS